MILPVIGKDLDCKRCRDGNKFVRRAQALYNLTNWLINMRSGLKTPPSRPRLGSRGRPEESRAAILEAAVHEFSREGVAGARTDAIARAARVNKALLYYYFKDKDTLYGAVLDQAFGGLSNALLKILAYAAGHFDYIASHPRYPRIVQGEMMRAGGAGSGQFQRIVKQYFRPLAGKLAQVIKEGQAKGEFRSGNPEQCLLSIIAVIVFYFINAPVMRMVSGSDPLSPELIAARRIAVLDFISAALFQKQVDSKGVRA